MVSKIKGLVTVLDSQRELIAAAADVSALRNGQRN